MELPTGIVREYLYKFAQQNTEPPNSGMVRFDAGAPYTSVTKLWFHNVNDSGTDIGPLLLLLSAGARVYVQDQNDSTAYADFDVSGDAIDKATYAEIPVTWRDNGGALTNNQIVVGYFQSAISAGGGGGAGPPTNLITTPAAPDANSYATVIEADQYNASRPFATSWMALEPEAKEDALRYAAVLLDSSFVWTGTPTTLEQQLCWPRNGMYTRNGAPIDPMVIPRELKMAQAEFARQLTVSDRTADLDAQKQGISSVKAGSVSVAFQNQSSGGSVVQMDAALQRATDPAFAYASRIIPDAVTILLVPSWYVRATVASSVGPRAFVEFVR